MAAIFYVSAQSSPPSPGGVPDYVLHAVEYLGLAVVVFRAVSGRLGARVTGARALWTMVVTVGYGASDEIHQLFVPFRTADLRDLLADAAGAAIGLSLCWAWHIINSPRAQIPDAKSRR